MLAVNVRAEYGLSRSRVVVNPRVFISIYNERSRPATGQMVLRQGLDVMGPVNNAEGRWAAIYVAWLVSPRQGRRCSTFMLCMDPTAIVTKFFLFLYIAGSLYV